MKSSKPTPQQIEAFARRALLNLPDSLEMQKSDLAVLVSILPHSDARAAAFKMLVGLQMSQAAQKEFCFSVASSQHDGKHNGGKI